ncbi:MAG: thiamine-phosphate kinase [Candidatus Eremiobacteraeota bacterium]|nr:thiamine-phosphate kinase [Candidatus Eremiobacteraeota bacterium]
MRALKQRFSEDDFVAAIARAIGQQPRRLRVGIGDDAAVWKARRSHLSLISTDALTDGVHFRAERSTPQALGHKALAQNLSDIAAMGGSPVLVVVAMGITAVVDDGWGRAFYAGLSALAARAHCAIAGGDIFRAAALTFALTVVGEVRASRLRLRSGARPGDYLCVTGPLGLAAAGLRITQSMRALVGEADGATLLRAYEMPQPRLLEGRFLGATRAVHALMDVSDGLSSDVARMARASGVDACIELQRLVPSPPLASFHDALDLMLHGGDDYELLVAVEPRALAHVQRRFQARFKRALSVIGRCEKGDGDVYAVDASGRRPLVAGGFDHFSQA